MMVLLTVLITAIATPLINILYDPTKPYMVNKRRTIQHHPPGKELRVLLCIHDEESVTGFINLLEVSNPSTSCPFSIFALHLVELVGRANPVFVDHEHQELPAKYAAYDNIHKALRLYEEGREDFLKLHAFTVVSPMRSMYQDICKLALVKKVTLIILPFHKEHLQRLVGTELVRAGVRSVNFSVLDHAPCSVGVLVDKGQFRRPLAAISSQHSMNHYAMLFLGGADAREALVYADRMAEKKDVRLTVVRFLAYNGEGDVEAEKKLDDGLVTWFWVKNEKNDRVVYREVVVRDGNQTVAAIQAVNDESFDLWIVGRRHGINPIFFEGLTDWSENQELGVIGDYVASADFDSSASVLVVQQQIMRAAGATKGASMGTHPWGLC